MLAQLINNPTQRSDGQIGDDVYVAYEWRIADDNKRELIRIYIGEKTLGQVLTYYRPKINPTYAEEEKNYQLADKLYNGKDHVIFPDGAWTSSYSRGNYGRNYACGGNWSGHCRALHPEIERMYYNQDTSWKQDMVLIGNDMMPVEPGIKPDGTLESIDCSKSWAIWYPSAADAMRYRLTAKQITEASLPIKSKHHLLSADYQSAVSRVLEVVSAYKL